MGCVDPGSRLAVVVLRLFHWRLPDVLNDELFMPALRTVATVSVDAFNSPVFAEATPAAGGVASVGSYSVFVDDRSGAVIHVRTPGGTGADVFMHWLSALHMGNVFGTPYKAVMSALGIVIAVLSGIGVIIWWRKLCSRRAMGRRRLEAGVNSVAAIGVLALFLGLHFARPLGGTLQYLL